MAEIKAKLNNLRIAPRKVRLVANLIRGKRVDEALSLLRFAAKKSSLPVKKLLESAIANAKNNYSSNKDLYIYKIMVNEGRRLRRFRARARGVAGPIRKRSSHIILSLKEIVVSDKGLKAAGLIGSKAKKLSERKTALKTAVEKKQRSFHKKEKETVVSKTASAATGGLRKYFRRKSF